MAAGLGVAEGSHGTEHLLTFAVLPEAGAGWRERYFWLERQNGEEQTTSMGRENSALPWTQLRHPSERVSVGSLWPERAPGHPSCASPQDQSSCSPARSPQSPACLCWGKTFLSPDML